MIKIRKIVKNKSVYIMYKCDFCCRLINGLIDLINELDLTMITEIEESVEEKVEQEIPVVKKKRGRKKKTK